MAPPLDSIDAFQRSVAGRFERLQAALVQLTNVFSRGPEDDRVRAAQALADAAHDLLSILAAPDQPQWLIQLRNVAKGVASQNHVNAEREFLDAMMRIGSEIRPIAFTSKAATEYDFDALYERYRVDEKVPELFDKLIATIKDMIDSGEVQVVAALQALQQVLDILQANRNGSYGAARQSTFAAAYVRNVGKIYLRGLPFVGSLYQAYEETIDELESAFTRVESQIQNHTKMVLLSRAPHLQQLEHISTSTPLLLLASEKPTEAGDKPD